ncbi:probable tRNA (guanine(26)-N(2))-dimethyltransferase 1 [Tanacetum coccineum]
MVAMVYNISRQLMLDCQSVWLTLLRSPSDENAKAWTGINRYPAFNRIFAVLITVSEVKNHPMKEQSSDESGSVILAKESVLQANFARAVASLNKAQAKKVARFLPNPERH